MAVMTEESTETIGEWKLANDSALLVKKVKGYQEKGEVLCGYESGCFGYTIQRTFAGAGISYLVLSANKVANQDGPAGRAVDCADADETASVKVFVAARLSGHIFQMCCAFAYRK
jgi:hypothetical protein